MGRETQAREGWWPADGGRGWMGVEVGLGVVLRMSDLVESCV
jgi:hypothetical protein